MLPALEAQLWRANSARARWRSNGCTHRRRHYKAVVPAVVHALCAVRQFKRVVHASCADQLWVVSSQQLSSRDAGDGEQCVGYESEGRSELIH